MTTIAERKHMNAVAELGCVVCLRIYGSHEPGPVELHHPRRLAGGWGRSSHMDVLPLCVEHHRGKTGLHGLGTKGFPKHWGFDEADLLEDTQKLLGK